MTGDRWSALAERLGTDLYLDLQPDPNAPTRGRSAQLRSRLADELRSAIADGRLTPGMRLPPYRSLAADLGLARGTVSSVYSELIAEGWLTARQGARTTVAPAPPSQRVSGRRVLPASHPQPSCPHRASHMTSPSASPTRRSSRVPHGPGRCGGRSRQPTTPRSVRRRPTAVNAYASRSPATSPAHVAFVLIPTRSY